MTAVQSLIKNKKQANKLKVCEKDVIIVTPPVIFIKVGNKMHAANCNFYTECRQRASSIAAEQND